jgi:hypothetical protein
MSINQVAEKIETQVPGAKAQIYQAVGTVTGVLNISDSKKPTLLIEEHTYRVSVHQRAFWKHQPGEIKSFLTYPKIIDGKLGFALRWVKSQAPESHIFILKGCWEEEENQAHLKIYRNQISFDGNFTALPLTWDKCPPADGQYWEIEAELRGDSFHVVSAIGPFDPPQKHQKEIKKAESNLPRPILKGDRTKAIKSELPSSMLKSAGTLIELPEAISESTKEPIAHASSGAIEPEEPETSPVVVEPVTSKSKKASGKSSASKKPSTTTETAEPKKAKASSSKKPMSLAADRLFLGKQLPTGQ